MPAYRHAAGSRSSREENARRSLGDDDAGVRLRRRGIDGGAWNCGRALAAVELRGTFASGWLALLHLEGWRGGCPFGAAAVTARPL